MHGSATEPGPVSKSPTVTPRPRRTAPSQAPTSCSARCTPPSLRASVPRTPSHGDCRRGSVCTGGTCPRLGPAAGSRFLLPRLSSDLGNPLDMLVPLLPGPRSLRRRRRRPSRRDNDLNAGAGPRRPLGTRCACRRRRLLPLSEPLRAVIERRHALRRIDTPLVFHLDGKPIRRLAETMVSRLPRSRAPRQASPRLPTNSLAQSATSRRAGGGGDEAHRARHARRVPAVQHPDR